MKKYRFTTPQRPGDELIVDLDPDHWWDENEPQVDEDELVQILDWWSDPVGRGYLIAEDGGRIAVVQVSDGGEPTIEWWSQSLSDDMWELESFPFHTLEYAEVD